jgi:hypothetical protein
MKKLLLAVSLLALLPAHGRAQLATFDGANAVAEAKSFLQDLKGYAQQLQSYEQDLRAYVQYVQTAQQALVIAQGVVHDPTNFGQYLALGNLAGVNLQGSLPVNPYALMGLTSGYGNITSLGGLMGKLSGVTSLVNTNMSVNAVNTCTAVTFACQQQTAQQQATAGQQAAAQTVMNDMANHQTALAALKVRSLASPDAKDAADISNQIQIEVAAIQADTAQLQATQAMAQAQQTIFANRSSEWMRGQQQLASPTPGG